MVKYATDFIVFLSDKILNDLFVYIEILMYIGKPNVVWLIKFTNLKYAYR